MDALVEKSAPPADDEDWVLTLALDPSPAEPQPHYAFYVPPPPDHGKFEADDGWGGAGNDIRRGEWDAAMCACCQHCVPNCWMTWCCPWVAAAQIATRLGTGSFLVTVYTLALLFVAQTVSVGIMVHEYAVADWSDPDVASQVDDPVQFTVCRLVYGATAIAFSVYAWHLRTKTRERFELPGSCCGDCARAWCCLCCVLAQLATHVKSYRPQSCSFGAPDTLPAYPGQSR